MVSRVQSSVLLVMPGSDGSKAEMPTPNILALPSHLDVMTQNMNFLNIFLQKSNLSGPMFAQSGQGGRLGQMSSKPSSSGGLSPKYSNSSFPVDFGGGGLLGSLSTNCRKLDKVEFLKTICLQSSLLNLFLTREFQVGVELNYGSEYIEMNLKPPAFIQ